MVHGELVASVDKDRASATFPGARHDLHLRLHTSPSRRQTTQQLAISMHNTDMYQMYMRVNVAATKLHQSWEILGRRLQQPTSWRSPPDAIFQTPVGRRQGESRIRAGNGRACFDLGCPCVANVALACCLTFYAALPTGCRGALCVFGRPGGRPGPGREAIGGHAGNASVRWMRRNPVRTRAGVSLSTGSGGCHGSRQSVASLRASLSWV